MRQSIARMAVQERRSFHAQVLTLLDVALERRAVAPGFEHGEIGIPEPLSLPTPDACRQEYAD